MREACAETAVSLGSTSMASDRGGAAQRGFHLAVGHGRILVLGRHRTGHLDKWANAHLALASWLTTRGDDSGAAHVVREREEHLAAIAPSRVPGLAAHARQVLASARQFPEM
ncbi:hypothetical protein [Amycolatopsis pigmentata]|uniref:Uncharacterized protein n=1 Tax=Amycolatopsis pigmentata TaxID=450801 RepID=A0ABW5FZN8_9PSEU